MDFKICQEKCQIEKTLTNKLRLHKSQNMQLLIEVVNEKQSG